jgi:uncharacterized DUF497 family protein
MDIEFDPVKNEKNLRERGLSFDHAARFDFSTAKIVEDRRKDYGERRYLALGKLGRRVHMLVFSETATGIRIISFRKANRREVKLYET